MRRIHFFSAAAGALVLVAPIGATAAPSPPPAIDQYIEVVPTSEGPGAAKSTPANVAPLPPTARRQVREQAGEDADALTSIATSPRFGAPPATEPAERTETRTPAPTEGEAAESDSGDEQATAEQAAPADTTGFPRDTRLTALLGAMAVSVVAAAGYGILRRRRV